jgi:hypothetical protein
VRHTDSGRGYTKAIATLAVLSALGFAAVRILPVYVRAFELQDHLRQLAIEAMAGQHPSVESLRNNVLAKAQDLELPVKSADVKIVYTTGRISIALDYTVPVDLKVYVLKLHFTPSADNRSLT